MAISREDYLKKFKKLTNIQESLIKQVKEMKIGDEDDVPYSSGIVEPGVEVQPTGPNLTSEVDEADDEKPAAPAPQPTTPESAPEDALDKTAAPAATPPPVDPAIPAPAGDPGLPPIDTAPAASGATPTDSIDAPQVDMTGGGMGMDTGPSQDDIQNELLKIQVSALEKLSAKFDDIESNLNSLNMQMAKYAAEVEEVKEPNPVEKVENRWEDSFPFKYKLNDLWDGNVFQGNQDLYPKEDIKKNDDGTYSATLGDLSQMLGSDIKNTFNEGVINLKKKLNEDLEPEQLEPEEDDCIISSNGFKYSVSCFGKFAGEFTEMDQALGTIKAQMEKHKFYPNIWFVNDHGNQSLIDIEGNIIK